MDETPQAVQDEQGQFVDELNIRPGMTVEVLTMDNRLTFVGKVERFRNGAITIRESRGGELPPVLYNKEIKLRFFQGQDSIVIHGKICGSSDQIWKLDRLESRSAKEQRAFFRQRISPNTRAVCARLAAPGKPARAERDCQILDISAGGMLISSQEEYELGDRLLISNVHLARSMDAFSFNCLVRRRGQREMGVIRYGCQFETLPSREQDRLLRAIFIVQREEIRNQKEHSL